MMVRSARPVFLARRSYRRRRLMDAARLLPVLGIVLVLLPALWSPAPGVAQAGIYLFAVWFALCLAAFGLARGLGPALDAEEETLAPPPPPAGAGYDLGVGSAALLGEAASTGFAAEAAAGAGTDLAATDRQAGTAPGGPAVPPPPAARTGAR